MRRLIAAVEALVVTLLFALLSYGAVTYCLRRGYILYYGDAVSHLNIARRVVDSRTPGFDQLGTVWLPLPHLAMLPLVTDDRLWRTGLAGAIPSAISYVLSAAFLYGAAKAAYVSRWAGAAAALAYGLNPNLLYLQSTPMTEPMWFACLLALLYFTVRYGRGPSLWWAGGAGVAALAGSLVRYEGWFIIPFVAVYLVAAGRRRRWLAALLFVLLATLGPAAWLVYNRWYFGDVLAFYSGPWSAMAIQGAAPYPGRGDWGQAWTQFGAATLLCTGLPLALAGAAGVLGGLWKRAWWPLMLLSLPPIFYVWSVRSAGLPIFVPQLSPHSYYNTRYGMALLPGTAVAAAALVACAGRRSARWVAPGIVLLAMWPWWWPWSWARWTDPPEERCITWKESQVNSKARLAWTKEAADFLAQNYRSRTGILTTFSDVTGIFEQAGIPLRDTLTWDNNPEWLAAIARPKLFLREEWAVAMAGDPVQTALLRAQLPGPMYTLQKIIFVKGAPVVEIYRRDSQRGVR